MDLWKFVNKNSKRMVSRKKPATPKRNKGNIVSVNKVDRQFASINLVSSVAKPKSRSAPKMSIVSLPKCTLQYALAITDPFHPSARGSCVPVGSAPTMKTHAFVRFDVVIGTTGLAYIYLTPGLANSVTSVFYTNAAYAGLTATPFSSNATLGGAGVASTINAGWSQVAHNGPFTAGQLIAGELSGLTTSAPVQGKIVSAGLRVQYTGTTLNESGLYYCLQEPTHNSLSGVTTATMGAFGDVNIEGVSRRPCMLTAHAIVQNELEFAGANPTNDLSTANALSILYPYSQGNQRWSTSYAGSATFSAGLTDPTVSAGYVVPIGTPIGAILLTGVAGQSVHVEGVFHLEYQGIAAAAMLTPTHPDSDGVSLVRTAALTLPAAKLDQPQADTWSLMHKALQGLMSAAKPFAVPAAKAALAAILG